MKKWLILTTLTALLLGACSTENEVSEQDSDKQTALVQKEDKNKSEKSDKEKKEKAEKEKLEIEKKEKEKKAEEAKKAEDAKKAEEAKKAEDAKKADEAKKAEDAENAVQTLEANQVTENVAPAQAAISNVADQGIKDSLTYRVGLGQNAINIRALQAAEAELARQAAEAEQARQAQQQAFASQPQQGAYRNCREARAAGAAPLYRGQPGYGSHLDRDGDGVACE